MTTTYLLAAFGILMIVAMAYISRLFLDALEKVIEQAQRERQDLEDRLLAIADKDAAVIHHANRELEPPDVSYVDEARELELQEQGAI